MTDKQKPVAIMLRLPPVLARWIKHQAVDSYRSCNGEIVHRLEQLRQQQLAQQPLGAQQ